MDMVSFRNASAILSNYKEQLVDVTLLLIMMLARGIYLRRKIRQCLSDMLMCALLSWFMKPALELMSMDGALSGLACLLLGYCGSGAAFRYLRERFGIKNARTPPPRS